MRRALAILGLWGACLLGGGAVQAAGLQVSPVTLTPGPARQGDGLWRGNTGTAPLDAQIRVFRWTQVDGQDRMEPADGLVVSPPMLQLPTHGRQLVPVIRNGPPPAGPGAGPGSATRIDADTTARLVDTTVTTTPGAVTVNARNEATIIAGAHGRAGAGARERQRPAARGPGGRGLSRAGG